MVKLPLFPKRKNKRQPAQAMVEFALTALVFLLLLVMIIEVARILQAYVTIQHAAREAARVAVTGEFNPTYGINPVAGWNEARTTADPLQSIRPCWPLFPDDVYVHARPLVNGSPDPLLYQPYRNPRTCTVEEAAIRNMAGLVLDPNAETTGPNYYEIVVSGSTKDVDPTSGTFERRALNGTEYSTAYSTFYPNTAPYTNVNSGGSRGYAGDPGQKVIVQIEYRVRMITPLISNIVPTVKLNAIATMTVETFGYTGLQREAVLPPASIEPQLMTSQVSPPDLFISSMTCQPGPFAPDDTTLCEVKVENQGVQSAPVSMLRIYLLSSQLPSLDAPPPDTVSAFIVSPDSMIGSLAGQNANTVTISVPVRFPAGVNATYYIYAWADANTDTVTPAPSAKPDGIIPEVNADWPDVARIKNNMAEVGPITVAGSPNLVVTKEVVGGNLSPTVGTNITYRITVANDAGTSNATDVIVNDDLPAGVTFVSDSGTASGPGSYDNSSGEWLVGDLAIDQTKTLDIVVTVNAGTSINWAAVQSSTPADLTPQAPVSVTITPASVGAVTMAITKSASPTEVDFGAGATQPVTYTVRVTNNSAAGGTATGVIVEDELPTAVLSGASNITFPTPPANTTCSISDSVRHVRCTITTLAGGGTSVDIPIRVVVDPAIAAGTTFDNQAQITAANEPLNGTLLSPAVTVAVRGADILIGKSTTGNVTNVSPGQQFTYTITAKNNGPSNAANVSVSDLLPSGVTYVPPYSATAGTYNSTTGLWTIGALSNGTTATLSIVVSVPTTATIGSTISNTATLQAGSTPPQGGSAADTATYVVTVSGSSADLALTKTVSPTGTVMTGTLLTYTLTLTNNGPSDVTNRAVQDTTLANAITGGLLQPVSATATTGTYANGQWTGINLNNGQSATATITVRAVGTQNTNVTFVNTASVVATAMSDSNLANNTATATIQINWPTPVFINAGGSGCNAVTWGDEDPAMNSRDFNWTVAPNTGWTFSGNGTPQSRIDLGDNHFIRNQSSPVVNLEAGGQNLFGCSTESSNALGSAFTYRFLNLAPGTWRLYLAFTETETTSWGRRILQVDTSNDGSNFTVLPGMDAFDIVWAINSNGLWPNMYWVSSGGGYYNIYHVIESFDSITVNTNGTLDVRFAKVGGRHNYGVVVSGLGIEYVGP